MRVAPIAHLGLQSVVVGHPEIHQYVDLADAAVDGQNRPRRISGRHGPHLARSRAIERRRGVQIDGAGEIGPALMHIVAAREQALHQLALGAD